MTTPYLHPHFIFCYPPLPNQCITHLVLVGHSKYSIVHAIHFHEVPRQTHIYLCMLHHCSTDITIDSAVMQSCGIFSCLDPSDFLLSSLNPSFSRNDFVYPFGFVLSDVFIAKRTRLFINVRCCTPAFAHTRERASFVNNDKCFLQLPSLCGMA